MTTKDSGNYTIVGLGELLWDLLPGGRQLGGAPANFAFHAAHLGNAARVVSRVGDDELGCELLARFKSLDLSCESVQIDSEHPTGTVPVKLDASGQPDFTIVEDVAYDYLAWTQPLQSLAAATDAVCFGSLAQRNAQSRETIRAFLEATRPDTVRVFDVNLRQAFYSTDVLAESLELSTIVKLNNDELPKVCALLACCGAGEVECARALIGKFRLDLVCVTRGGRGSLLVNAKTSVVHPGIEVDVVDTVGSGDAFTAALVHHYLRGASLDKISDAANRLGAWVATHAGATLVPSEDVLRDIL